MINMFTLKFIVLFGFDVVAIFISQGVRRFEMFEFLSEKINFAGLGGSKLSSFEPDTSHP